ncbi:MAG: PAS domain S-box protein, partial [Tepidiforma sp.]
MTDELRADAGLDALFALDLFPVGVFQTDLLGRCLRVNPRWCALAGRTAEDALGYGYLDAIHPDDRPRVIEATRQHIEADRPLRIEYRIVRPNGEVRWVLAQATALHGPGGERTGYLGTVTDITGRIEAEQALRESEERYRSLIELNPDFVTVHRGGVMLYVNEAGLRMMRAREPSDMVGHHILEFVRPEFRELAVDRMRPYLTGVVPQATLLPGGDVHRIERKLAARAVVGAVDHRV